MRTITMTVGLAFAVCAASSVHAQRPSVEPRWTIELSGDGAFPTSKLGDAELDAGFGLGANVRLRLQRHLRVYGGWEWHRFASDQLLTGQETDIEETGYTFGLRFEHAFRGEEVSTASRSAVPGYWLMAGGLYDHLEIENEDGDIVEDSGHGLGWEVGVGVTLPIASRLALTPGVRYRALSRELTLGSTTRDVSLRYVSTVVGFAIAF